MRLTNFLLLLLAFYWADARLQFAQVFFRHGQRFPTTYLTFPTEHVDLSAADNLDRGELTKIGIQQAYDLGTNLREYYAANFTGEIYHASNLITYSGRDNRTVASALAVLAGFFPPSKNQTWNSRLPWIPIPVFAMPELDDVSFGILDNCPYYVGAAFNVSADQAIFNKYRDLADYLSRQTGIPIYDLDRLQKVVDGIISRAEFNGTLPLPDWANQVEFIERLRHLQNHFHREFIPSLLPDTGAWLFDQLVGAFDDFVNNRTLHKMVLYSAHDTNIMTLGIFLNISLVNETLQPTASYLVFELWDGAPNDDFLVHAFLHNKLNGTRQRLPIGLCEEPCYYQKFRGIATRMSVLDFNNRCMDIGTNSTLFGTLAGILLALCILMLIGLIAAIWACMGWRRKYKLLTDEEQRPLITHVVRHEEVIRR